MVQVAAAAAAAGIGWGVLNREVDYVAKLRGTSQAPIFAVTTDQEEVGRIQGRQFAVFLKDGGGILYIEGPATGEVGRLRTSGMQSTKPRDVTPRVLRGDWTEDSGYKAVKSWLALGTSQQMGIRLIGCQNDAMAIGARRAFEEVAESQARKDWLSLPFTGCDGCHPAYHGPGLGNHDQSHSLGHTAATTHSQPAQFLSRARKDNRKTGLEARVCLRDRH